jgi:hypothetical protein
MNTLIKCSPFLIVGFLFMVASQAHAQPANLVLQDTTIATVATFTATNSITAGPNFTIAGTGDATFVTGGSIYLRTGVVIIQGGALRTIQDTITVDVQPPGAPLPTKFALRQNYPNPFNSVTTLAFDLPRSSHVVLVVYNILGQVVATAIDETLPAGRHLHAFDAGRFASGVYIYRLTARQTRLPDGQADGGQAGEYSETERMILLR